MRPLGGGWINGTLSLIGASAGSGKSRSMAYFAAEALKNNKKVVFITLELDEDETLANVAIFPNQKNMVGKC